MNSAVVWFTLVVLFGAFSYCLASVFQSRAENWVRRWEQERPVTSHSDDNIRRLLKHTETSLSSTQCGYQACDNRWTFHDWFFRSYRKTSAVAEMGGNRTLRTQDTSAPALRHWCRSVRTVRHQGTSAPRHFGTSERTFRH